MVSLTVVACRPCLGTQAQAASGIRTLQAARLLREIRGAIYAETLGDTRRSADRCNGRDHDVAATEPFARLARRGVEPFREICRRSPLPAG